jgi:cell wall-associated NlpC family hydrolase
MAASRGGISTGAVLLAGAGGVAVWAAVKGVSLGSGLRTLLSGHTLPAGEDLVLTATTPAGPPAIASNSAIVAAASRYLGTGSVYRWGGASPRGWDCSGFVNWTLNHDLGLAIPGYAPGTFTGSGHGPVTAQWAIWSGAVNIPRAQLAAGDLVVWPAVHMGIAIDNTHMINAPGPNGTPAPVISRIDGAAHGPLLCRRLKG